MEEEEMLHGPPVLTWDKDHLHCMLTVVLAGLSVVLSRLTGCMTISVFIEYGFTTLHSGTTISDGGKSARSVFVQIQNCLSLSSVITEF